MVDRREVVVAGVVAAAQTAAAVPKPNRTERYATMTDETFMGCLALSLPIDTSVFLFAL